MIGNAKPKQMHFAVVMVISWVLFNLGSIVSQLLYWFYQTRSFLDEFLYSAMMMSIAWCVFVVPWSVIIFLVFRNRSINNRRTSWLLAPSVVMLLFSLFVMTKTAYSPRALFEKKVIDPVPEAITGIKAYGVGYGFGNPQYVFYFNSDPESFQQVLNSRPFQPSSNTLMETPFYNLSKWPGSGWPDPGDWDETEIYVDSSTGNWYHIVVSGDHRRVYFNVLYM